MYTGKMINQQPFMTTNHEEKETFTEEDAINITIEHGYDGSEFGTAVWKSRGCLNPTRTMDALIHKLETIYHTVEVKGKGKKRIYILKDKKEEMTVREYKYKGKLPNDNDLTMQEYIFNHLLEKGTGSPKTYNKWGDEFELFLPTYFPNEKLIDEIKDLHSGVLFNPKEIISEFFNAIKNHNYAIVHNSFNRLEKEGRISQISVYIFKTIEGIHKEVSKDEYDYALALKRNLVESHGINYKHYLLSLRSSHKNEKMKRIIGEVKEQMVKEFKIDYMYEMIKVSITDIQVKKDIHREEFDQAYFQKFIKLAMDRQIRKDYQETKSFWRRTYLMNTLKILSLILKDKLEIDGLEQLLHKEMKIKSSEEFLDYAGDFDEVEF